MGYEQAKLRGAASYVSWVVTRTLSLTTRESARRDPYGRLPDALGMCDDLRRAGRSARFILCIRPPPYGCVAPACVESALRLACCCHGEEGPLAWGASPARARAHLDRPGGPNRHAIEQGTQLSLSLRFRGLTVIREHNN